MKVIKVNNSNSDNFSDVLIAESLTEFWAKEVTKLLNYKWGGENAQNYFKVVSDDYKLTIEDY
jgi:hypothetical protein